MGKEFVRVFIQVDSINTPSNPVPVMLPAYTIYEDGTGRVFRNVGT